MNNDNLFSVALRATSIILNDKYLEAMKNNDVKEMEIMNIRLETLEILTQVFDEVLRLMGDQSDD